MAACQNRVNKTLLDQAESYLPAFPDSALTLLNQINEKKLTAKEHAQFIFVKTRIEAKKTQVTSLGKKICMMQRYIMKITTGL